MLLYEGQKRALAELMAGMDEDARWLLLIGPDGIGKSTVLQSLLAQLELTDSEVVVCDGSEAAEADDLVTALRRQLQLPSPRRPLLGRGQPAADILASRLASNNPLAVLVDNAHQLSPGSLTLLAELAAATSTGDAGVWVVLVGTPPLEDRALRACGKTKGVRCRLTPLTAAEVAQYVERRIRDDAEKLPSFSQDAVAQIARYTKGIPGLINTLCDVAARRPSARLTSRVSAETVEEAAAQLGLEPAVEKKTSERADSVFSDADPEDDEVAKKRLERRRWLGISLLTGAVALAAGLIIYVWPMLTTFVRTTLHGLTAGSPPGATRTTPGPEGDERSRQPRREPAAPGRAARGSTTDLTPRREGGERRSPALDRPEKASRPERAQPATPSPEQVAALIAGARDGRTEDLTRLLATGVTPNVRDAHGVTPLMQAVQHGQMPAVGVLLEGGAQINARDRGGITPIMLAVINERAEALQVLLDRGAEVNARSGAGWTALTFAAWKGDPDLVRLLLRHGATPNVVDKQGWSPLDYASAQLRSPWSDAERPPIDADLPAMTRGTRHSEVIPLLQGGAGR
jgi:type II secretory pathway predicted ATPase ExeA